MLPQCDTRDTLYIAFWFHIWHLYCLVIWSVVDMSWFIFVCVCLSSDANNIFCESLEKSCCRCSWAMHKELICSLSWGFLNIILNGPSGKVFCFNQSLSKCCPSLMCRQMGHVIKEEFSPHSERRVSKTTQLGCSWCIDRNKQAFIRVPTNIVNLLV